MRVKAIGQNPDGHQVARARPTSPQTLLVEFASHIKVDEKASRSVLIDQDVTSRNIAVQDAV